MTGTASPAEELPTGTARLPPVPAEDPAPFDRRVVCLLGLPFDLVDTQGAADRIHDAARRRQRCVLATPNLNFVVNALRDNAFRDSVLHSDLSIPDGMPIVWVAKLCGVPIAGRVSGSGLLEHLRKGDPGRPLSVYLFGGADGVAQAAADRLNAERGGLVCKGYASPGFGSIDELSQPGYLADINASGADFLVVSLGAKKGQLWIERNRDRLQVPVVSHLGAALNFIAGTVRRAPMWMQRTGLEWLWRIREEPGLWRRYLGDALVFMRLLLRVLPLAWTLRRARPSAGELSTASCLVDESLRDATVRISGAWSAENLSALRDAFRRVAQADREINLDLARMSHADPEVLGLMLLLHGHQQARGRSLRCSAVSSRMQRLIGQTSMDYILSAGKQTELRRPALQN